MTLHVHDAHPPPEAPRVAEAATDRPRAAATVAPAAGPRRRLPPAARAVSPLAILALWAVVTESGAVDPLVLPSPRTVAAAGWRVATDGTLPAALGVSLERATVGLAVGLVVGLAAGVAVGLSRVGEAVVDPPLQMLRTLPLLGLTPLLILWTGIGETPKIALVAIGSLFPVYLNTVAGIQAVDPRLLEAGRSLGLGRGELLRHVVLPSSLPQVLVGLRQALGIAWISLIVGEQINASSGLGHLINDAREYLQTDVVLVGLVVYALLGLLTDGAVRILERKALAWRSSNR